MRGECPHLAGGRLSDRVDSLPTKPSYPVQQPAFRSGRNPPFGAGQE
jgi:hypothetical protein